MADHELVDPRCHCRLRQWQIKSNDDNRSRRRRRTSSPILLNLLLILLLVFSLLYQPVEATRTINAYRKRQRDCMQAMHRPHQVTRSNPRRLSSDQNQFNVPAAPSRGRHGRRSPPSPWANSRRYNASAHEVPSGPNPISN